MSYDTTVSAFEAKTHLSELLRETEKGVSFTIFRRGKAVAKLIPVGKKQTAQGKVDLVNALRAIREKVKGNVNIKQLIEEGRRS